MRIKDWVKVGGGSELRGGRQPTQGSGFYSGAFGKRQRMRPGVLGRERAGAMRSVWVSWGSLRAAGAQLGPRWAGRGVAVLSGSQHPACCRQV